MNVKERLKFYIKHIDLSNKAFEKSINVSNGYVNNISKSIGLEILETIIEKYSNLNLEWLITGKGEMLRNREILPNNPELQLEIEQLKEENSELKSKLIACYEKMGVNSTDFKSKAS